jgi:hypothetical protein
VNHRRRDEAGRRSRGRGLAAVAFTPASSGESAPHFETAFREGVSLLQGCLRIDTTNPTGNEKLAADFLKGIFGREGIEARVDDLGHGRSTAT